jgi:N-acetylmuramoyl-L-alanine amidase
MKKIIIIGILAILVIVYGKHVYETVVSVKNSVVESASTVDDKARIKEILTSDKDKVVIVDPGHGGMDPGKVGVHEELEKDINLSIAHKLKDRLLSCGFSVLMTRTDNDALYDATARNKKMADLNKRVEIVNSSDAVCLVSIHQNSFTSSDQKGAQVFYYTTSLLSQGLAKQVQDTLKTNIAPDNKRVEKENNAYYLLKKTYKPGIIVECGFLSNPEEASLLATEVYQQKLADSVCEGIVKWANGIIDENGAESGMN